MATLTCGEKRVKEVFSPVSAWLLIKMHACCRLAK